MDDADDDKHQQQRVERRAEGDFPEHPGGQPQVIEKVVPQTLKAEHGEMAQVRVLSVGEDQRLGCK